MKIFKRILLILLIMSFISVKAYENTIFKVDIPEEYKLGESDNKNNYMWSNENKYFSITVETNSVKKYNIDLFTEEDIKKQKQYVEEAINKELEKYKITATVSDAVKVSSGEFNALEYDIYYPTKKVIGYDMHQKERLYTTKNYIITTVFNNDNEFKEDDDYSKIINSFNILDEKITKEESKSSLYFKFIPVIVLGVILAILGVIRDHLKKRNK